jgi:methionyl-tRNA formyltransferase
LKVVIASSSPVAIPLISALNASSTHQLLSLLTNPDKATGRGMHVVANELATWTESLGINIQKPENNDELKKIIESIKPEVVITIAYGRIIPHELLEIPKYGWINVHFSLLPRWRGAAPVQWAILNGDKQTGITVFKLDKGMDTGPVYLEQATPINDDENSDGLLKRLSQIGSDLAIKSLELISEGVTPKPQASIGITLAPKISKNHGKIDWTQSSDQVVNRFRALSSNPGVWSLLGELRIKIDALVASSLVDQIKPADIVINGERLFVGVLDGVIEILILTPAGRSKMSAAEFIRGLPSREGLQLG